MKVLSIEEEFRASGTSISEPQFRTFTTIDLGKGFKTKCWVDHRNDAAFISLYNNTWEVSHLTATRDTSITYKTTGPLHSSLTVTQKIPGNKWYLAPQPSITAKRTNTIAGKQNVVSATWDMLYRSGNASTQLYWGDDHDYKLNIMGGTNGSWLVGARAKVQKGLLHSVAMEYSNTVGPVAIAKSRLSDGTKLRLAVDQHNVNVLAENIAGEALNEKSATVQLIVNVPLHKVNEPSVQLNLRYNFL